MAYSRTTWVDGTTPAINATNLNNIEQGIVDLDNGTVKLTGDQTVAGNKTFTHVVSMTEGYNNGYTFKDDRVVAPHHHPG